jgi:hypothetical protein
MTEYDLLIHVSADIGDALTPLMPNWKTVSKKLLVHYYIVRIIYSISRMRQQNADYKLQGNRFYHSEVLRNNGARIENTLQVDKDPRRFS